MDSHCPASLCLRPVVLVLLAVLITACSAAPTPAPTPPPAATRAAPTAAATAAPPLPTLTPTPAGCRERAGRVETAQIPSQSLPRPLEVRIYTPPCYDALAPAYPLLLLLHGQGAAGDQWQRLGIAAASDRLIAAGEIAPLLIVMPTEADTLANPFESGYETALIEELLPWVESHYNACRERTCRSIGGLSRGAAWAMYLGLSHPQLFGAIGAHSFPSFYGDYTRLPYLAREIPSGQAPRIWMDSGHRDRYLSQARHYSQLLTENKLAHEWHELQGEHDEVYWAKYAPDYLRWYGAPFLDTN